MQFMLLFSRQGKLRLQKWYVPLCDKEKKKITRELVQTVLARKPKMCSFLEWRDLKIVYKRARLKTGAVWPMGRSYKGAASRPPCQPIGCQSKFILFSASVLCVVNVFVSSVSHSWQPTC
uniref:Adaptor related protein complex 1 subunit sigma 2 n=1 Tax=Cyprinus carpio TaxID=7962 RepID=A0A8C1Y1A9_CYPCA